jgi:sec-independent protein translocase protein TatA
MPGFIGMPEILLLGLVVLLVFGPKRLPEMGRSMGRGMREFKDSITGDKDTADRFAVPQDVDEIEIATVVPVVPVVPVERAEHSRVA